MHGAVSHDANHRAAVLGPVLEIPEFAQSLFKYGFGRIHHGLDLAPELLQNGACVLQLRLRVILGVRGFAAALMHGENQDAAGMLRGAVLEQFALRIHQNTVQASCTHTPMHICTAVAMLDT